MLIKKDSLLFLEMVWTRGESCLVHGLENKPPLLLPALDSDLVNGLFWTSFLSFNVKRYSEQNRVNFNWGKPIHQLTALIIAH